MVNISNFLGYLRVLHRKTAFEVAAVLGISVSTYLKIESGKRDIEFNLLYKLLGLYKMSFYDFASGVGMEEKPPATLLLALNALNTEVLLKVKQLILLKNNNKNNKENDDTI